MHEAPDIFIRDVIVADLDALTALRPTRELHAERIATHCDDADKRYILAMIANRVVGFGVIYFRGDPMWNRPDQVPLIMDLWVAPAYRGRGIGRRIAEFLERAARERGFACVYLQVQSQRNPAAVEMYQRMGYQKLQQQPHKALYAEVDERGQIREGEEFILDMQKWL
jgi:ribosomal protein S18 acetylase RimI-like enzyme